MAGSTEFFGQRNPQAVLKHGVLTRYAYYFAGRAGSGTRRRRVAFVDGYAGEGRYEDGNLGSPLLLWSEAKKAEVFGRDVTLALVEADHARHARLARSLAEHGVRADRLLKAELKDVVLELLQTYEDRATLLFVDPFGLAFERSTFEELLRARRSTPLDVLYHFSLSSVARMGPAALLEGPGGPNARHLDQALGMVEWRREFEGAARTASATRAALNVATAFRESVRHETGWPSIAVPVRQAPHQLPKYLLVLFSRDAQARWDFADQAGSAHVDWLHFCDTADFEANLVVNEASGATPLFRLEAPRREAIEQLLKEQAARYLPRHLVGLLERHSGLRLLDKTEEVYGEMLGRARETHVRAAVKSLHAGGRIDDDGTHEFQCRAMHSIGGQSAG